MPDKTKEQLREALVAIASGSLRTMTEWCFANGAILGMATSSNHMGLMALRVARAALWGLQDNHGILVKLEPAKPSRANVGRDAASNSARIRGEKL